MSALTIRTRYVTRPGSNVGGILATGLGHSHRRTMDQSMTGAANHRAAAVTLAERLGFPEAALSEPDDFHFRSDRLTGSGYVFTLTTGHQS